jgi:outer membrane lipoprotein-sorting protein
MRKAFFAAFVLSALASTAQDITTADQYFLQVSERYAQINDYEAKIAIGTAKTTMTGSVIYRAPTLLRIDFTQPPDQVIAFDGERLTVYVPEFKAVLAQSVITEPGTRGTAAGLATREGLKMMRRNYTVAFEISPEPTVLEGAPSERVVRLALTRKTVAEGFKTIIISISPESKLIRRLEGSTLANEKFVFDFTGIKINQNIPESRFIYDSPASANVYNNFLFNSDEQKN